MPDLLSGERLKALERELLPGAGECPFVLHKLVAGKIDLRHFDGGRDATYVLVACREREKNPSGTVTIGYAPSVAGTLLIYDVTRHRLQGKARPFECDWNQGDNRLFAILPVQIEAIQARIEIQFGIPTLRVSFLDARGEVIQGALPYEASLEKVDGAVELLHFGATNREGKATTRLPAGVSQQAGQCTIRSLLTGGTVSLDLMPRP